jgi:hypothetical protein
MPKVLLTVYMKKKEDYFHNTGVPYTLNLNALIIFTEYHPILVM